MCKLNLKLFSDATILNRTLKIVASICVTAFITMIATVAVNNCIGKQQQNFTPPPFDDNCEVGAPEVPDNLNYTPLRVEEGYMIYICGRLVLKNNMVDVYLTSPEDNNVWIRLKILDEKDNLLCETGLIRPGEYLKSALIAKKLKHDTNVKVKIVAYEPESYYSRGSVTLNTVINVN